MTSPPIPDAELAARIFNAHFPDAVGRVTRFPTGLCHYVYEVITAAGCAYVVRIAAPASRYYLEGGLYWHPRLQAVGVPVPALLASQIGEPYSYMILERLPGADLGQVIAELTTPARHTLANRIASIQQAVGALPSAGKFGFAASYAHAQAAGRSSWIDVVAAEVERSETRLHGVGRISAAYAERVRALLAAHEPYLRRIEPTPFLDDTTTKNVIVHEGRLTGIVDTDEICFGDSLFTVGLTKMALLSLGAGIDYTEFWLDALGADSTQRRIVDVYAAVFCLDFMAELGQTFARHVAFDETRAEQLCSIFDQIIYGLHQR